MPELNSNTQIVTNSKYIFFTLFLVALPQICHAADLENCKSDCTYYKSDCVKEANKVSQHELDLYTLDTKPHNILEAREEQKRAKESRRFERLNKCDEAYSSCTIQCVTPNFK